MWLNVNFMHDKMQTMCLRAYLVIKILAAFKTKKYIYSGNLIFIIINSYGAHFFVWVVTLRGKITARPTQITLVRLFRSYWKLFRLFIGPIRSILGGLHLL